MSYFPNCLIWRREETVDVLFACHTCNLYRLRCALKSNIHIRLLPVQLWTMKCDTGLKTLWEIQDAFSCGKGLVQIASRQGLLLLCKWTWSRIWTRNCTSNAQNINSPKQEHECSYSYEEGRVWAWAGRGVTCQSSCQPLSVSLSWITRLPGGSSSSTSSALHATAAPGSPVAHIFTSSGRETTGPSKVFHCACNISKHEEPIILVSHAVWLRKSRCAARSNLGIMLTPEMIVKVIGVAFHGSGSASTNDGVECWPSLQSNAAVLGCWQTWLPMVTSLRFDCPLPCVAVARYETRILQNQQTAMFPGQIVSVFESCGKLSHSYSRHQWNQEDFLRKTSARLATHTHTRKDRQGKLAPWQTRLCDQCLHWHIKLHKWSATRNHHSSFLGGQNLYTNDLRPILEFLRL